MIWAVFRPRLYSKRDYQNPSKPPFAARKIFADCPNEPEESQKQGTETENNRYACHN